MPLTDDFLLTQMTIDLADGPRSRARLHVDPDDVRGRGLDVTFLNVRQVPDMTDATVQLWWQHDAAPALRGLEPFEAVDAATGHFKVHYPSAMGRSAGTVTAKIMVAEGDRTVAIPLPKLEVSADRADPDATPSEDTFSVLATLLAQYSEGVGEITEVTEAAREAAGAANGAASTANAAAGRAETAIASVDGAVSRAVAGAESAEAAAELANTAAGTAGKAASDIERAAANGEFDGATFTPSVSEDGTLSWTNDKGRDNPGDATIRGPVGPAGPAGPRGERGPEGPRGETGAGLRVLDSYDSLDSLESAHPEGGDPGDAYMADGSYYIWNGGAWVDCGPLQGAKGDRGETGPAGPAGPMGPTGPTGPDGKVGPQGERGPKGDPGTDARITSFTATVDAVHSESPSVEVTLGGETGAQTVALAFTGIMGPTGPKGDRGPEGAKGDTGADGPKGERGETGPAGPAGPTGSAAVISGVTASSDATHKESPTVTAKLGGSTGAQTIDFQFSGLVGATGPAGPAGPAGAQGQQGPAGKDGTTPDAKALFLAAHPVGDYWWTSTTVNPQTEYGGKWERVKDRFVWAMGDSDKVGNTGGAKTVTLTTAEMPSHTHTGPSHTHSLNKHVHAMGSHNHSLNSHTHTMSHSHSMNHSHSLSENTGTLGFGTTGETYANRILVTGSGRSTVSYTGSTGTYSGSTGGASGYTGYNAAIDTGEATGDTGTGGTGSTGSAGSGGAHENMPPYVCAYCWHRTA